MKNEPYEDKMKSSKIFGKGKCNFEDMIMNLPAEW